MRQSGMQKLMLFCFAMVFAALFVSGAPRLIASGDDVKHEVGIRNGAVQTYWCDMVHSELLDGQSACCGEDRTVLRMAADRFYAHTGVHDCAVLNADANGNLLREVSYMRSVYQAFALGDGFA